MRRRNKLARFFPQRSHTRDGGGGTLPPSAGSWGWIGTSPHARDKDLPPFRLRGVDGPCCAATSHVNHVSWSGGRPSEHGGGSEPSPVGHRHLRFCGDQGRRAFVPDRRQHTGDGAAAHVGAPDAHAPSYKRLRGRVFGFNERLSMEQQYETKGGCILPWIRGSWIIYRRILS